MKTLPPTCSDTFLKASGDHLCIAVWLTPRARVERIDGVIDGALKVLVAAPPVDKRANDALLRLLAKGCGYRSAICRL
jgi:uncharacterized protein